MSDFKYIMLKAISPYTGREKEFAFIFPTEITWDIFSYLKRLCRMEDRLDIETASSGILDILTLRCFSEADRNLLSTRIETDNQVIKNDSMVSDYKYIIISCEHPNGLIQEMPIIFNKLLVHKTVYESLKWGLFRSNSIGVDILSAGFLNLDSLNCHGLSESLDIKSRKEDSQLIRSYNTLLKI